MTHSCCFQKSKPYKFKRKDNHLTCWKQQAMSIKLELDNRLQWLVVFSPLSFSSISNRVNVWVNSLSIPSLSISRSDSKFLTSYYQGYSLSVTLHSWQILVSTINSLGKCLIFQHLSMARLLKPVKAEKKWLLSFLCLRNDIPMQSTLTLFHSSNNNKLPTQQEVSASKAEGLPVVAKLVNKNTKVTNITNFFHSNQVFTNHISMRQVLATLKLNQERLEWYILKDSI